MKQNYFTKLFAALVSKRVGMFLVFLLIACVVWFISQMSNTGSAEVPVTVCIYSSSNNRMPRMCSEEDLPVIVSATGFNIIKQRVSPRAVYVDIKSQQIRKKEARSYMLVSSIQNDITQQLLKNEIKVESYEKDTIYFLTGTDVEAFFEQPDAYNSMNQIE